MTSTPLNTRRLRQLLREVSRENAHPDVILKIEGGPDSSQKTPEPLYMFYTNHPLRKTAGWKRIR